jgi:hypothetical protein
MNPNTFIPLIVALVAVGACSDPSRPVSSSSYATFQEASSSGILELGWLPRNLPESAADILESHHIDNGELWVRFRFSDADIKTLLGRCSADSSAQLPDKRRTKLDADWWPVGLTSGSDPAVRKRWKIYWCANQVHAQTTMAAGVAIDPLERVAWYWIVRN